MQRFPTGNYKDDVLVREHAAASYSTAIDGHGLILDGGHDRVSTARGKFNAGLILEAQNDGTVGFL